MDQILKFSAVYGSETNKPGHPHFWFHGTDQASHHCSPQMGSKSLTTMDPSPSQLLEGAAVDEH